jgi:catechol 2,3-dioxygenase
MPAGLITGLRGVDLGVPDVAAQARFYTGTWRLASVAERKGSVYLRGTGATHHTLALHARAQPSLLCLISAFPQVSDLRVDALIIRRSLVQISRAPGTVDICDAGIAA